MAGRWLYSVTKILHVAGRWLYQKLTKFAHYQSQTRSSQYQCAYQVLYKKKAIEIRPVHEAIPNQITTISKNTPSLVWYLLKLLSGNESTDGRTLTDGRGPNYNNNTPPLSCGGAWKGDKYFLIQNSKMKKKSLYYRNCICQTNCWSLTKFKPYICEKEHRREKKQKKQMKSKIKITSSNHRKKIFKFQKNLIERCIRNCRYLDRRTNARTRVISSSPPPTPGEKKNVAYQWLLYMDAW